MGLSFGTSAHYDSIGQGHFRAPPRDSVHSQQNDTSNATNVHRAPHTRGGQFQSLSGTNPLFSHDQIFSNGYGEASLSRAYTPLTFTPANRPDDYPHQSLNHHHTSSKDNIVKAEARFSNETGIKETKHSEDSKFSSPEELWNAHAASAAMGLHDDLDSEHLQV